MQASYPVIDRATRRRQLHRRLEPWLLGLWGFSVTVTAGLLIKQDGPADQRIGAVSGEIAAMASR